MKKEQIRDVLNYSKSKDLLKMLLKCSDEELINNVIYILKKLSSSNRKEVEKYILIKEYINNRDIDCIEYFIFNSFILDTYSYNDQIKIINFIKEKNKLYKNSYDKYFLNYKLKED